MEMGSNFRHKPQNGNPDSNGDVISYGKVDTFNTSLLAKPPLEDAMKVEAICCPLLPQGSGISPEVWSPFYPYDPSLRESSFFTSNSLPTSDEDGGSLWHNQDIRQDSKILATTPLAVLPPGEVYVPFPPGTGKNAGSYYS
jgi:hypothetical protein